MNQQTPCPECGKPLPDGKSVCPACLMGQALASKTMADTLHGDEALPGPPSPEEIADKFPQFEIVECLGRGGMGVVYKARQKSLDRWVAIKVLAPERVHDERFAEHFEREAKTLAKMSQPNIVTVFDHGETEGLFYIVMEYVDGVNLRDLLREGKIEPEQALAIVPPICEALEYAHDHGVVHRDIKPENILIDREGRVKIADFGIAALIGADADHSGTPPYMAPEQQAAGGTIDRRADIYALGAVLYEMLTGERPDKDLVAPSKRVEIDVRLDEIVLRALEKEPARRYQTAGEFRTVVETMAAKTPMEEPPSSREVRPPAAAPVQAASFSRTAIVGACWAPLFFIALVPMFIVSSVTAGQSQGPEWWQYLLMFTLLPIGLTAPFGTTILGSVALTQIRRSAGKLYGLGLALFDVLLFPLLALDALIVWLWLLFAHMVENGLQIKHAVWLLPAVATVIVVDVLIVRRAWRAANKPVGDGVPGSAGPATTPPRKSRMKFAVIIGLVIAAVAALLFWAQQPRMIDERNIAADSPDEMFTAMGQTYHAMRIFDSDRTFYRFQVQGRAGAVFERWDVPVPYNKLATSYVLLSRDEVLFGKHGEIVWSDDGKRVSFRVRGTEVSAYNTEDGGHSYQGGFLPQREVTLPAPARTGTSFLNLDTGEVVVPSVTAVLNWHLGESQRIQMHPKICEWMRSTGTDLRMRAGIPGLTLLDGVSITMAEFADPNADPRAFDTVSAAEVADSVTAVEQSLSGAPRAEPRLFGLESNRVHAVKTREGAIALVEILEESRLGPTRLRFKLVKPDTAVQDAYVDEWEWRASTLHDLESGHRDGCLNLRTGQMDTLTEERWRTERRDPLLTVEFASGKMGLAVGGAREFLLVEAGKEVARDPQKIAQLLRDSAGTNGEDSHEVIDDEGGIFHILPGDGEGRIYAFTVTMPHGLPVAGMIEIVQADRKAETLRIRQRLLPTGAAREVAGTEGRAASAGTGELSIIDTSGSPVEGARVQFDQLIEGKYVMAASFTSDIEGKVAIPDIKYATHLFLRVEAQGYVSRKYSHSQKLSRDPDGEWFTGASDGVRSRSVVLLMGGTISGRVLGPDGRPLAGAPLSMTTNCDYKVYWRGAGASSDRNSYFVANHLRAISDENGEFRFDGVPPGDLLIYYPWEGPIQGEIDSGRWKPWTLPGQDYPQPPVADRAWGKTIRLTEGEHREDIVVDLWESSAWVNGEVVDAAGRTVAGALVRAVAKLENDTLLSWPDSFDGGRTTTDADGRFRLRGLPPGTIRIPVSHPRLGSPEETVEIELVRGKAARCRIVMTGTLAAGAGTEEKTSTHPPEMEPKSDDRTSNQRSAVEASASPDSDRIPITPAIKEQIESTDARLADPIVQGLMGLRHKHPELVRFAEDVRHQVEVLNGAIHVSLVYEYNYDGDDDGGTKTKAAGPSDTSQPWCHIALDIRPLDAEPKHVPHGAEKAIQWNGQATVRHYDLSGAGLFVGVAVRTGSDALRAEVNRIIDRELNALIRDDGDGGGDEARKTPENAARNFMTAFRDGDVDAALKWMSPEMKAHAQIRNVIEELSKELNKLYAGKLDRLTKFTEWYAQNQDANTRFIGTRLAGLPADDGSDREHGLYLILSPTPEGWKVAHLDDAYSDKPLSYYVDRIVSIRPGKGPVFRQEATERPVDSGETAELQRAQPELVRPTVIQLPDADTTDGPRVLDLASGALLDAPDGGFKEIANHFNQLGKGDLAWDNALSTLRGARVNEWTGHVWNLLAPAHESMGVRVYRLKLPKQLLVTTAEGDKYLVKVSARADDGVTIRYHRNDAGAPPGAPGDHNDAQPGPPAAPAVGQAKAQKAPKAQALQFADLGTMKEYATALAIYQVDAGSLPPNLEMLVFRKILPELQLMENHATGNRELPLYHGGPDLQVGESDTSRIMLLAAPSPSPDGRRVVVFLDASVKVIDESRYQSQLAWQRKPPMERTIDDFLESCAEKGVADNGQMFAVLGMAEFIERYGDGQSAMRKHHDKLAPLMRWAIDVATGEPSPPFLKYLRGVHRDGDPRHAKQAFLMLKMFGVEEHPADGASAEDLPQPDRDMLLVHARALEKGDFAALEQVWEFECDLDRRLGRLLAAAFAHAEGMTVELVSTQRLNDDSLFACYLMRNGPELFGAVAAPHFTTFHRREDGWRCAPPASLRTLAPARTMGTGQIGRRGIAEKLIYQRYGHSDGAEQLARLKAMRDAAILLARPPHKLTSYEGLADSLKMAIRTEEESSEESWRDSWHQLIKEQPEKVLPGPDDFFVSFYRECEAGDAKLSRRFSFAGEEGSFCAERFPCMTDNMLLEAHIKAVPGSNDPQVEIQFTGSGARILESVSRQSIGKRLACVVDGKVISTPKIMTQINTGSLVITGGFSQEEAEAIVKKMSKLREQARDFLDSLEKQQAAVDASQ